MKYIAETTKFYYILPYPRKLNDVSANVASELDLPILSAIFGRLTSVVGP